MKPQIRLLGGPALHLDGVWQTPTITRPVLLLSYLAYREAWVDRDELVALFWSETRQRKGQQSLRSLLYQAKGGPHGQGLEVEPRRVRWAIRTDVHAFTKAVSTSDWKTAVGVYRGTFLQRIPGDDSAVFEAWLEQTRDELHRSWRDAALHVAADLSAEGCAADASNLLVRLLAYDFLDEEVVQACMRAHAAVGDRAQALEIFHTFRERLAVELDMPPLASTEQLAESIRSDPEATPIRAPDQEQAVRTGPSSIPRPPTPFVGRLRDLTEIGSHLARPGTRLVTLLGPGGMGKSRLSIELLEAHRHEFEDGVAFVALEGLRSAADIPTAVASAVGLDLTGGVAVADEVLRHLESRAMLVVLDNFEHLIEDGVSFVQRLLAAAPRCIFVSTSRIVLGLPGEVVYDVAGLTVPPSPQVHDPERYDAVRLFVGSARRARSDFTVRKTDRADLVRLCSMLDGMPLALELAASWVRLYEVSDLIGVLERDPDLLKSTGAVSSERHRSLRGVFEHSWRLLDDEERRVLSTLGVFDGSFSLEAANAVAQASANTLLALIDKSLVRRTASRRFSLQMVVRQYATEHATSLAVDRERHAAYYLGIVERWGAELKGATPTEALETLQEDLDNIRAAWSWACEHDRFDLCKPALESLNIFFTGRALLHEGYAFSELALGRLGDRPEAHFRARLHHQLAYFARRLDRHEASLEHASAALHLALDLPSSRALTIDCLCELAMTNCWTGQFADAVTYAERALTYAEELDDPDRLNRCTSALALVKRYLGQFDEALPLYQEVLGYERRLGRQVTLIRTLSDVGKLWVDVGRLSEAEVLFREGLELAERHDLPYEVAFMWEGLSQCSYLRGDLDGAQRQSETALRFAEAVHDQIGVAIQCAYLAKVLVARGEPSRAGTFLRRALTIAWEKNELPEVFKHFVTWAALPHEDSERTATLLSWVAGHPGAQAVSRREALELLGERDLAPREVDLSPDALRRTVHGLLGTPL